MTAYSFENVMKMSSKQRCEPMLKMIKKHEYMESKGIGCTLNDKKKKNFFGVRYFTLCSSGSDISGSDCKHYSGI